MKTVRDILAELKIVERPSMGGTFLTTCPECSHMRKKKNDRCLSVKVDALGVQYRCHHCQWGGGRYFDSSGPNKDWQGKGSRYPQKQQRSLASYYR